MRVSFFYNKTLISYLLKFLIAFFVLDYGTKGIIALSAPGGYYSSFIHNYFDYPSLLRFLLLYSSRFLLSALGYHVYLQDAFTLKIQGGVGVHIVYSCLGYGVISFWLAFVYANSAALKKKIIWMLGGSIAICAINILRISIFLISINKNQSFIFNINNHTAFNIAAYAIIFIMILLFDKSQKISLNIDDK